MIRALVLATVLATASCGATQPAEPVAATRPASGPTAAEAAEPLEQRFERYVCAGAAACSARDIADPSLDYAGWLASSLEVEPLARLEVIDSFHVEAGPGEDGTSLSLGAVSFRSVDSDQTRAIVARLAEIPDGAFRDGLVIMRFTSRVGADRLDLLFTDSFDPRMDLFLGSV